MKGLFIKDLLILLRNGRNTLYVLLVYCVVFGIITQEAPMVGGMAVMMLTMLSVSTFSYDNLARWESYALCLPVTRRQMVQSKYLLSLLLAAIGSLLALIIGLGIALVKGSPIGEAVAVSIGLLGVSVLLVSILLPLIYKLGIEKSKIVFIAVFGLPTLLIYLLVKLQVPLPTPEDLKKLLWLVPVLLLALLAGSYQISCRIFQRKEF